MKKGIQTRTAILEQAAPVFNTRGFAGTSLQDLMRATGLQKGGLYNHYASKEELALAAFDHAIEKLALRYQLALDGPGDTIARLITLAEVMLRNFEDPAVEGGCMVMNMAIESDDAHPVLRERARAAMTRLLQLIGVQVKLGKASGLIRADVNPRDVATLLVATYEGALMLSKLYDDAAHIARARRHMTAYIRALRTAARA
jgi:TetR/AcrR family transcriptional regulator, transcriptional repressor for nem operon